VTAALLQFPLDTTVRDIPGHLRKLADRIEAGEYGEVNTVALALMGGSFEAFGWGDGFENSAMGPAAACMFGAAQLRIVQAIERHGRE
jgi:hypothetical protein